MAPEVRFEVAAPAPNTDFVHRLIRQYGRVWEVFEGLLIGAKLHRWRIVGPIFTIRHEGDVGSFWKHPYWASCESLDAEGGG
jgi:hypothetical protein